MQLVHFKSYHDESNGFHDNRDVYGMLPPPLDPYTRHMIRQWVHGSSGLSLGFGIGLGKKTTPLPSWA